MVKILVSLTMLLLGRIPSLRSSFSKAISISDKSEGNFEVTATRIRSSPFSLKWSGDITKAGLLLVAERSVKGKGTRMRLPRLYFIPYLVFFIIPEAER